MALRVIDDGRIGFTSTTNPDIEPDLVDRAAALAEFGSEAFFEFPPPTGYPDVPIVDDRISDVTTAQMIATGKELIERLREPWPDLLCDASVGWAAGRMWLSNSNGVEYSYRQTSYHVFLGGQLIRGTDMLNIWAGHNSSRWFGRRGDRADPFGTPPPTRILKGAGPGPVRRRSSSVHAPRRQRGAIGAAAVRIQRQKHRHRRVPPRWAGWRKGSRRGHHHI